MGEREMLERAAKAAGIEIVGYADRMLALPKYDGSLIVRHPAGGDVEWNSREDDGDALRLAVKLSITLDFSGRSETVQARVYAHLPKKYRWWASSGPHWVRQEYVPEEMWTTGRAEDVRFAEWYLQNEPEVVRGLEAATRLAITRAAASLTPAPEHGENHG
ncbi:hypothetical protein ACEN9J_02780 [Variovorax sp. Varisp41]|uniref:hypothetical protein n=1 Tax=Variovorax sp. Varisp41 TaxID=3243033 RepID=UPI0039B3C32E